jgi:hypothetical protein
LQRLALDVVVAQVFHNQLHIAEKFDPPVLLLNFGDVTAARDGVGII